MIHEYSDEISYNILTSRQNYVKDFHLHNFYELFLLLKNEKQTIYKRIYIHIPPAFFQKYGAKDMDLSACFTSRNPGENNLIQLTDHQLAYFTGQFQFILENRKHTLPGKELLLETYLLQLLVFVNNLFSRFSSTSYLQSKSSAGRREKCNRNLLFIRVYKL